MNRSREPGDAQSGAVATVLVTGATGSVGSEVVRALRERPGVRVRIGSRTTGAPPAGVDAVRVDFDDPRTLRPAFEGVDAFFSVSPLVEHQAAQALPVLDAAVAAGVRHCVRLSSRATGWDRESVLRQWHREVEAAVERSGMTFVHLRPCSFMQNVLGPPLDGARDRGVLSMPLGQGRIPFVDAFDLGEAAASCLVAPSAHAGRTYVLTGAEALGGDDLAAALAQHLGRAVRYSATSHDDARRAASARGLPEWLVESGLRIYARAEQGDESVVDPTLERLLGRPPRAFAEFLSSLGRSALGS